MSIAVACVAVAAFLPIVCTGIAKSGRFSAGPDRFDNRRPREWLARQDGYRARANAAQGNSWEALMVFAPAVLAAQQAGAPQAFIDGLALAFVVARVIYIALYLANRAGLRSLLWVVSYGISLSLFLLAVI